MKLTTKLFVSLLLFTVCFSNFHSSVIAQEPDVTVVEENTTTTKSAQQTEAESIRQEYDEAVSEETGLLEEIDEAKRKVQELRDQLVLIDAAIGQVNLDLQNASAHVAEVEQQTAQAQERVVQAEAAVEEQKVRLQKQAIANYISSGTGSSQLLLMLQSESVDEAEIKITYATSVSHAQKDILNAYVETRQNLQQEQTIVEALRTEAYTAQTLVELRKIDLEKTRSEKAVAEFVAAQTELNQQVAIKTVSDKRFEYEQRLVLLQTVSDGISERLAKAQKDQVLPATTSSMFVLPLVGASVSSNFGPRIHPIYGTGRMHNGVDFTAPHGTNVHAVGQGVVLSAQFENGYGNCIVIDHGNGIGTLYAHLSGFYVAEGQIVTPGQVIGAEGSTGLSTGPHLHFEIRLFGQPVNPMPYLNQSSADFVSSITAPVDTVPNTTSTTQEP